MPAFAAAYGPVRGEPRMPAPDAMLMMTPPAAIRLAAALAPWKAEVRLSSSWARQISSGVSASSRTVFSSEPPTLLTHTSRRPNSSIVERASRSERSRMSPPTTSGRRPRLDTPAAVTPRSAARRAFTTTSHPASASPHAIARPMPRPEPVTTAT